MSKRKFSLEVTCTSISEEADDITNWDLCVICQSTTNEKLICPHESNNRNKDIGYLGLINDLLKFDELHLLPQTLKLNRLRVDGKVLVESLIVHNANYHKTCRNKYDKYHFDRAVTKIAKDKATPITSKKTRSSFESRNYLNICFFCDTQDDATNLRLASTMKLDANVRSAVQQLGDEKLLAEMSEGDMVAIEGKYHIKCLNNLYNKLRKQNNEIKRTKSYIQSHFN